MENNVVRKEYYFFFFLRYQYISMDVINSVCVNLQKTLIVILIHTINVAIDSVGRNIYQCGIPLLREANIRLRAKCDRREPEVLPCILERSALSRADAERLASLRSLKLEASEP